MTSTIGPASPQDLAAIVSLLTRVELPSEGIGDHLATTLVARDDASVVGSAALETYGDVALLRSVAVSEAHRGAGLGQRLVEAALDLAHERGVGAVYLLTTTAPDFFARRFGFRPIVRSQVPNAIRGSVEFARLCPDTAHVMVRDGSFMRTILFACVHNAGRSQMAAAFFNAFTDPAKAHAVSAGTNPADHVHPQVVQVMRELGIDISNTRPRRLTSELAAPAHLLVTMGCGEQCPAVSALRHTDWDLEDPSGRSIERVRAIRDEIRRLVEGLIETNGWRRDRTRG